MAAELRLIPGSLDEFEQKLYETQARLITEQKTEENVEYVTIVAVIDLP